MKMKIQAMVIGLMTLMVVGTGQIYMSEYLAGAGPGLAPETWGWEASEIVWDSLNLQKIAWDPAYLACEEVYGPGILFDDILPVIDKEAHEELQALLDQYRYTKPWSVPEFMCGSVSAAAWYIMVTELDLDAYLVHDYYHNHMWILIKWTEDPLRWIAVEPTADMENTLGKAIWPRTIKDVYYSAGLMFNTSSEVWAMGQKLDERYVSTRRYPDIPIEKKS